MRLLSIFLLTSILFAPVPVQGQKSNKKITVTGKVLDANKKPVAGAVIFIDNARTDVVTNESGNYSIKVRPDAKEILVFTLLNGSLEEEINGRTVIDFILGDRIQNTKPENMPVEKNTGGMAKSERNNRRDYDTKDATYSTYQDIYEMIKGRFAGVEVSGKSIKIMGSSSLNVSTEPLFVVDGVIVNNIDDISPQTVKSIEVLKGPDATVYGTRGSNGVIVITRLTGKDNQ